MLTCAVDELTRCCAAYVIMMLRASSAMPFLRLFGSAIMICTGQRAVCTGHYHRARKRVVANFRYTLGFTSISAQRRSSASFRYRLTSPHMPAQQKPDAEQAGCLTAWAPDLVWSSPSRSGRALSRSMNVSSARQPISITQGGYMPQLASCTSSRKLTVFILCPAALHLVLLL